MFWNEYAQSDIGQLQNSTAGNICLPENIKYFDFFTCKPLVAKRFDLLTQRKKMETILGCSTNVLIFLDNNYIHITIVDTKI